MTREDIDNIIRIICPNDEDFEKPIISPAYLKKELETLALEQEPCEDAISRQAVLEIQAKYAEHIGATNFWQMRDDIKALPSVKQEPKTGHREYNDIYDHYLCGNCKTIVMDYDNFCPNCGARMVEQEVRDKE